MIKKQKLSLTKIIVVVFTIIRLLYFSACNQQDKCEDEMNVEEKLSLEQKINRAEEQYDVEILRKKMPWLDIVSARWKQVLLSDYVNSEIPGPTDILTIGMLKLDSDYLKKIKIEYQWYDETRTIPATVVTEEMTGYILQTSQEYKESYLSYLEGYNVSIFIDFEREIVLFSF